MADSIMSRAATMEIPINSNGDSRNIPEDDGLEQVSSRAAACCVFRSGLLISQEGDKGKEQLQMTMFP